MFWDKDHHLHVNARNLFCIYVCNLLSVGSVLKLYTNATIFVFLFFFLLYLLLVAFMDYQTMLIYRVVNYLGIFWGLLFYISQMVRNAQKEYMLRNLISLFVYHIFLWSMVKRKAFGAGDGYLLAAISLFLTGLFQGEKIWEVFLLHLCFSYVLFYLLHRKEIFQNKKIQKAFAPSIVISTILTIGFY